MAGFPTFKHLELGIKRDNTSLCLLVFVQLLPSPCQFLFVQERTAGTFNANQWQSVIKREENKITSSFSCCHSDSRT